MQHVIIGVDPHKLSATIEVVDQHEHFLGSGRFSTDRAGYKAMRTYAKAWPERVWAVEGDNGVGRPQPSGHWERGFQSLKSAMASSTAATASNWFAVGDQCQPNSYLDQ